MSDTHYYILTFSEVKGALIAQDYDFHGFNDEVLSEGQYVQNWPLGIQITVSGKKPLDNLFCPLKPWHLVSQMVKNVCEKHDIVGVQFLQLKIVHQSGVEIPGYYILNVVEIVNGLDFEHTTWMTDQKWDVEYPQLNIFKIALKKSLVTNKDIFRILPSKVEVIVSKRLKTILEEENADMGFKFLPITAY
jgi:hypothetical protein